MNSTSALAIIKRLNINNVGVVETVYTTDLKSVAFGLGGSSPPSDTNFPPIDTIFSLGNKGLPGSQGYLLCSSLQHTTLPQLSLCYCIFRDFSNLKFCKKVLQTVWTQFFAPKGRQKKGLENRVFFQSKSVPKFSILGTVGTVFLICTFFNAVIISVRSCISESPFCVLLTE